MKNTRFRDIVGAKNYSCVYYYDEETEDGEKEIVKGVLKWENTNKMLG
jgi:hypothetical protein